MPGGGLPNLGPQYIQIPFVSPGWALGFLFIIHILIVAFIMGAAWILVFTGSMPDRPENKKFERFTHYFAKRLEQTYSFGATFAVFGITVLLGLFPRYFSVLVTALNWPLAVSFGSWVLMTFMVLLYYFTWERLRPKNRWAHQSLILVYALAETTFMVMITLFTSYQLIPPATPNAAAAVQNPVWLPDALHRVAGNISYAGYLFAGWGAWNSYRYRRTGTSVDRAYYHWAAHLGILWGLGFELAQLPIGTYFVLAIQHAGPIGQQTYTKMMLTPGSTSWEWLLQIMLLSLMFVVTEIYMWSNIRAVVAERRGRVALQRLRQLAPVAPRTPTAAQHANISRQAEQTAELGEEMPEGMAALRPVDRFAELWTGVGLWIVIAAGVLACIPDVVPVIGTMTAKWVALGIFLVWSIVSMVLYFIVTRRMTWGNMPRLAMGALLVGSGCIMLLMMTMGVVRYTNPQTSVIEHQVPVPAIRVQSILLPDR